MPESTRNDFPERTAEDDAALREIKRNFMWHYCKTIVLIDGHRLRARAMAWLWLLGDRPAPRMGEDFFAGAHPVGRAQ